MLRQPLWQFSQGRLQHFERVRERHSGQVTLIAALAVHQGRLGGITRPQLDLAPTVGTGRGRHGQSRAPGTSPQNGDLHAGTARQ